MDLAIGLLGGFVLGIGASSIAWMITERLSQPKLEVRPDSSRYQAQLVGSAGHEFYHVVVSNAPTRWPVPGRQPAWACTARVEVYRPDGSREIAGEVHARWTSQPEPLLPVVVQGQQANVLDPARIMQSRRMDVHGHHDELVAVAIKFEDQADCHIFSNESYVHPQWQNPAWRLGPGRYRLRVIILFQGGRSITDFELQNAGTTRASLSLKPWESSAADAV